MNQGRRNRYQCLICDSIIASRIPHLQKHHDFNDHTLYEIEEKEKWKRMKKEKKRKANDRKS